MSDLLSQTMMHARILKRTLALLLQRQKTIQMLSFTYLTDADTTDTLILKFSFKNALWYRFDGIKTLCCRHIVVRHGNNSKDIPLTIQGIFTKKHYTIKLRPDVVFIVEAAATINNRHVRHENLRRQNS